MDNYIINNATLLIVPFARGKSKVYEDDKEFVVNRTTLNIINDSCIFYGSSFEGRREAAKGLISADMKVPVLVEDSNGVIFFPISSCIARNSIWVSYVNLVNYKKNDDLSTKLYFKNFKNVVINCRYNLIDNQFNRCVKLSILLQKRKELFGESCNVISDEIC